MLPFVLLLGLGIVTSLSAHKNTRPADDLPGDLLIHQYLRMRTERIHACFLEDIKTKGDWLQRLPKYRDEYLYMLGLSPMPTKTAINATITGSLQGDGFVVERLHYQSRPGLYVTGNVYRPSSLDSDNRLPAVLYVCGHTARGRNGNKTAFQSNGIWFARHGYVCLIIDSLQLGEIRSVHRGTHSKNRWWWHSRGYTPAGVECWNGIRGIDYLCSRPDVDPERIAVTGISGGGAATFWIAAADDRVRVAVPISGMADLPSYVTNRCINRHCDCMFFYNVFEWPWTRIAALLAPRPLLFINSDHDPLFPMDANERIINRLERVYCLFGNGDLVDSVVSIGGHDYRKDIRQAASRFINMHLKNDSRIVLDSEEDLVTDNRKNLHHPLGPKALRVFPTDNDLPRDAINTTIDRVFVPIAKVQPPAPGKFIPWKNKLLTELRRVSFRMFPDRIKPAQLKEQLSPSTIRLESEEGIAVYLQHKTPPQTAPSKRILMVVTAAEHSDSPDWLANIEQPSDTIYFCDVRGIGNTRWIRRNPANYVERAHALLGSTVDTGRVWDVIALARYVQAELADGKPVHWVGKGSAGIIVAYAALFEPDITHLTVIDPPITHMSCEAPQFLNVLRVCDIPDVLGMLAPKSLTLVDATNEAGTKISHIYELAGASENLHVK